ncbi:hypothetical protein ACFE6N_11555 [Pedobacter sp. BG31]|uniref:hypothetical protein n=1 Tax=Pedobacter sp. BG31 TaxID=3349697 RepID=UPI0035F244AE
MKKPYQEEIPRSIIKGSGVIHADLNTSKGTGNLLYVSLECTVVGLYNNPYMLFTTPEFNENILPLNISKDIYEVKEIILQPSFSIETRNAVTYSIIPKWLSNFKKIESLRLEYVELDNLNYLIDLPIQHLIFENIKYSNDKKLIHAIKQFKYLKEISYDRSLPTEVIRLIEELNLKLTHIIN